MIAQVIGWKFNHQAGMSTSGGVITAFPNGIPTQAEQDLWTVEYEVYEAQQAINQEALAYLSSTDWLLWRELDGGKAMPLNIKQLRVEARVSIV